jgi:hypothetical protein
MSIEAMKQALEALERADKINGYANNKKAINALRQAIAEAEKQEPVGYLYDWLNPENRDEVIRDWFAASTYVIEKDKGFNVRPLYTAPPKRQWVGLMLGVRVDEDSVIIKTKNNDAARELCEKLLKEKNT